MPAGAAATIPGLQAFVAEVPVGNQWLALCWNGDVMRVAAWAITLGGHVGIGLGDYAYSRFGKPHNGELVDKVAKMAHTLGREVATPAQAREMLGREVATPAQAREILKMPPRASLSKELQATAN